jgi:aspartyl-tRNA(Asn)/glutamyl-tRNA(Gln) amidotransferase subunit C
MNSKQKNAPNYISITKDTVQHVAHLARIELSPAELEKLSGQLQDILDFIDKLKKIDIKGINPTSHILPMNNVLREDKQRASLSINKALENAPHREGNFFGVPQVIE